MSTDEPTRPENSNAPDPLRPPDRGSALDPLLTRRRLVLHGAQGLALMGAGGFLAACGGSSSGGASASGTTSGSPGKPVRGGKLNVGMITAGSAETVDPGLAVAYVDVLRVYQLYDYLFQPGPGKQFEVVEPRLATSAESNKDSTVWTLQLRDGVSWHNGKPFTADDVIWSINSWSEGTNYAGIYAIPFIDFKGVRKRGKLTVEIPLVRPTAEFPTLLMINNLAIIQNGSTPQSIASHPIGTGPFKFVSFQPGSQSVFARNPEYWEGEGKPYVDEVVVNSTFQDETSRYNALLGGQIDVAPVFPANYAREQGSSGQLTILDSPSGQGQAFTMRVDKGPFTDQRVREAMKLLTNRQELIDGVFPGYAQIGNDLEGRFTKYFADDLKAAFDPEKAKSLLKAAGQENLSLTLPTSNASPGFVEAATLFAQQGEAAGVKIQVEQTSASTYYTEAGGYLSREFGQVTGNSWASMTVVAATYFVKGAPYDETGWSTQPGGGSQSLISEAIAELDPGKAKELWHEVQTQWFEKDGHLLWSFLNFIDAAAPKISGLSSGVANPLNNFRLLDAWISS